MSIPANAVPLGAPLVPLIAMPDGITEPSDVVTKSSMVEELMGSVDVEAAWDAMNPLFHSMVIAGRDGVAIDTMLGAEVTLERCAVAIGVAIRRQ
jgi:hypothetical protein